MFNEKEENKKKNYIIEAYKEVKDAVERNDIALLKSILIVKFFRPYLLKNELEQLLVENGEFVTWALIEMILERLDEEEYINFICQFSIPDWLKIISVEKIHELIKILKDKDEYYIKRMRSANILMGINKLSENEINELKSIFFDEKEDWRIRSEAIGLILGDFRHGMYYYATIDELSMVITGIAIYETLADIELDKKNSDIYTEAILKIDYAILYRKCSKWIFSPNRLGIIYEEGDFKNAYKCLLRKIIDNYTDMIEQGPENAHAFYNRGLAYDKFKKSQSAIDDFTKVIDLNPKHVLAYFNRGYSYDLLGECQKAIDDYTKAIELDPKYAWAYNNRGFAYRSLGDHRKAIDDYTKVIGLGYEHDNAYYNRACVYAIKGEKNKALSDLGNAINLDKKNKNLAKSDEDFKTLYDDPDFKKLVE